MKLHLYIFKLFFVITASQAANFGRRNEMLKDVIKSFGQPSRLTTFLCKSDDAISFHKFFVNELIIVGNADINKRPLPYPVPAEHVVFIVDITCPNVTSLFLDADSRYLFLSPYRWILFNDTENADVLETFNELKIIFDKINVLVDSEVLIAMNNSESEYVLTEIYKRRIGYPLLKEKFGVWSQNTGLQNFLNPKVTSVRRSDLMGTELVSSIVVTHNETFNHFTDYRQKHIDTITKVDYVLVNHLANFVNATLEYRIKHTWGYYNASDNSWSGMIGDLHRREADIGGTALFFTKDRINVIDYIAMVTPTRSKFVFRQPKLSYVTNVYTLPFHWSVWASTFSLILLCSFGLYLAYKYESKTNRNHYLHSQGLRDNWLDILFIAYSAMCQQGVPATPSHWSGRIICIALFLALMFLYTSYSANIVSLLQSPTTSIQTLNDLLHSRLQLGVDDTVFNHFYFSTETEPVRKAIYEQKITPSGQKNKFMEIHEGVRRMRNGLFAFHMETGPGYEIVQETFQEDEKCGLQEIQYLEVIDPYLAVEKNTSYKKMLKIGLRKIYESGLQTREVGLLYTKKPICVSRGSSFISVGIIDCYAAAEVLAAGIVLAIAVYLVEFLFHKSQMYYSSHNNKNAGKIYFKNSELNK